MVPGAVQCDRPEVVRQGVLTESGELDHEVDPIDDHSADSLSQAREHVFVKPRAGGRRKPLALQDLVQALYTR